ncbi:hypothetical protein IU469_31975 [Nocardia puris]|uniref:Uncharacterized protein n=1 Tax=Nocardia puris TaxID=208602 RepID=A0A366D799_9NOCA|nr:hypothetical protein [Nocardia puris]MBF6215939.1 hypothetical protein [Nocardia puris]MBF6370291.1 hypothetical protein [Nocardia puris]RBO85158.1 hypothetical protein DFR74_1156 [Nocardia puris]
MSELATAFTTVSDLLDAGRHDEARRVFADAVAEHATEADLTRWGQLLKVFTSMPYPVARAYLRGVWRSADPEVRAWLDRNVSRTDPCLHRPAEPDTWRPWLYTVPLVAASYPVRRMIATDDTPRTYGVTPSIPTEIAARRARRKPEHIDAIRSKRRPVREPYVVRDYIWNQFLVDAAPAFEASPWDRVYVEQVADQIRLERDRRGQRTREDFDAVAVANRRTGLRVRTDDRPQILYGGNDIDYDTFAISTSPVWVCVYCFAERACADHFQTGPDGARLSDDGLCAQCRDTDRPGIAPLAPGFTLADEVGAYCRFLAQHYPAAARGVLNSLRLRSSSLRVRGLLTAFLDQFDESSTEIAQVIPLQPVALRNGRCLACHMPDEIIDEDDLCDECRTKYAAAVPA